MRFQACTGVISSAKPKFEERSRRRSKPVLGTSQLGGPLVCAVGPEEPLKSKGAEAVRVCPAGGEESFKVCSICDKQGLSRLSDRRISCCRHR